MSGEGEGLLVVGLLVGLLVPGLLVPGLPLPKPSTPTFSPTPTPRATISTACIARQTYTPYTAGWRADTYRDDS